MLDLRQLVTDIRARIEAVGLASNLTREQLAPKLGVTYSWLCKFMQGHPSVANMRIGTLQKLLDGLVALERLVEKFRKEVAA